MERQIIVVNQNTNARTTLTGEFNTLGDIKAALNTQSFRYSEDNEFREISSRTQLMDDNSQLPISVIRNGEQSNNLVIAIIAKNKKIASGSNRATLYKIIKENNLSQAIKDKYSKNYTNLSTSLLEEAVESLSTVLTDTTSISLEERVALLEKQISILAKGKVIETSDNSFNSLKDSFLTDDEVNDLLDEMNW